MTPLDLIGWAVAIGIAWAILTSCIPLEGWVSADCRGGLYMPRLRYRSKTPGSRLEERFLILWNEVGEPELEREFRFHDKRRWRADCVHMESRSLIEIEGGIRVNGRHNRAAGFNAALEKIHRSGNDTRCQSRAGNQRADFPPASHFGSAAACRPMPASTGFRAHLPGVSSLISAKKVENEKSDLS